MNIPNLVKAIGVRKNVYRRVRIKKAERVVLGNEKTARCVDVTFRFYLDDSQQEHGLGPTLHLCDRIEEGARVALAGAFLPNKTD